MSTSEAFPIRVSHGPAAGFGLDFASTVAGKAFGVSGFREGFGACRRAAGSCCKRARLLGVRFHDGIRGLNLGLRSESFRSGWGRGGGGEE